MDRARGGEGPPGKGGTSGTDPYQARPGPDGGPGSSRPPPPGSGRTSPRKTTAPRATPSDPRIRGHRKVHKRGRLGKCIGEMYSTWRAAAGPVASEDHRVGGPAVGSLGTWRARTFPAASSASARVAVRNGPGLVTALVGRLFFIRALRALGAARGPEASPGA